MGLGGRDVIAGEGLGIGGYRRQGGLILIGVWVKEGELGLGFNFCFVLIFILVCFVFYFI